VIKKYTISSNKWKAITKPGQSGFCWLHKNIRGSGTLYVNHSALGYPSNCGFKVREPKWNVDVFFLDAISDEDVFYAKTTSSRNKIEIMVDVFFD
jgi:hypothetical protein